MPSTKKVTRKNINGHFAEPAALAAEYLRGVSASLESFSEFDSFVAALKGFVSDDRYLKGQAELSELKSVDAKLPDFEALSGEETVIAVASKSGNSGYLKYQGRVDSKPFGVGDFHLMSAIAGCVGSLVAQAERFQRNERSHAVLQFLINQLPIGVLCFEESGQLILQSNLAKRLLGAHGLNAFEEELASMRRDGEQRTKLHFEIEDRFIYAEGRVFEVDEGGSVQAFVLYDMSASRGKLISELERIAYMSESRGAKGALALFESRESAGEAYRLIKQIGPELDLQPHRIQPLDAYACGCLFSGKSVSDIRFLLKACLSVVSLKGLRVAVVPYDSLESPDSPGEQWVSAAREALAPQDSAFLPELIVMPDYGPVLESLELILADECRLRPVKDTDEAIRWIQSGQVDGVFVGLDAIDPADLALTRSVIKTASSGFAVFYTTFTRRTMAIRQYGLSQNDKILEKPFDSDAIVEAVALQFDLNGAAP